MRWFLSFCILLVTVASKGESPKQFLATHCVRCHGSETQEAERRFDDLGDSPTTVAQLERWKDALDRINLGDMPPVDEPQPSDQLRVAIAEEMQSILANASKKLTAGSNATVLRRLNRFEYDRSVRQLLSLQDMLIDPTGDFPPDESNHGYRNIGESLVLSDFLLSRYLEASSKYLRAAIAPSQRPESQTWTFEAPFYQTANRHDGKDRPGKYQHIRKNYDDDGGFLWISRFTKGVPVSGNYQIRVKADGIGRDYPYPERVLKIPKDDPIRMQVVAGNAKFGDLETNNPSDRVLANFELADNDPQWYEATVWMDEGFQPRIAFPNGPLGVKRFRKTLVRAFPEKFSGYIDGYVPRYQNMHPDYDPKESRELIERFRQEQKQLKDAGKKYAIFGTSQSINLRDAWSQFYSEYDGPRVRVHEIQITGPVADTWPPASWRRLFGTETPSDENARRLIDQFALRAFRRPVNQSTLRSLHELYRSERDQSKAAIDAILTTYQAILCSPNFVYLHQGVGKLDAYDLASRLSYFLWSAPPDEELLAAAADGTLRRAEVLRRQARRLLSDDRSEVMIRQFLDSWLGLSKLGTMLPSQKTHPEYFVQDLEAAMRGEVGLFVRDIIDNDRPITNLLDADYSFVNGPLARHYGIEGIHGQPFQRVSLDDPRRGGLLGMAAVLTATANGIETSPVVRGVWVLESILGTPPSPPPADVEPLEPDIRGASSIRDQLKKHRHVATCNACHQKIDPLGFTLECFDEVGRYREQYVQAKKSVPVDTAGVLPTGESFANITELKPLLLARSDRFAKNMTKKMLAYATGRMPSIEDEIDAEQIATNRDASELGMRTLIEAVVASDAFRR
ncbi:MAG: DUF1592 domain-containing protein [Rubripirellula sp.]